MSFDDLQTLASMLNIGIPIVVAIVVVIFCVCNIDKLLLLLSSLQTAVSFVSHRARKGAIANAIRGKMIKASKAIQPFGSKVLLQDLKIEWVKDESAETFIKNNQVIIRMTQQRNPHKNYVTAVTAFVGEALLPQAKRYIDPGILDMSKISVSRMLVLNGDLEALNYFDENILDPILEDDEDAKRIYDQLHILDKNGMFINILLNEYSKASQKIFPDQPDPLLVAESKELLLYLFRIAMGSFSDVSELQFNREYFRIHIFLAARTETYAKAGLKPYLKHIGKSLSQGTETVYIFGLGRKIAIAKEIADSVKDTDFRVDAVIPHHYRHKSLKDGRTVHGVCYEVSVYEE